MLELLLLLAVALELATILIYLKLQKRLNRKYPPLRQKPNATAFEKWREQQHIAYLLSGYSKQPYRQIKAIGLWMIFMFGCLGGCMAIFLVSDFVNWPAFMFPIGLLLSGLGVMRAQRHHLLAQYSAWQALVEQDPDIAANFSVTEANLPQLKLRVSKLMNLYWVWLLAIIFAVFGVFCALGLKF